MDPLAPGTTRLTAVSGAGGKGPACFLVEHDARRLLLDMGLVPQPGRLPDVSRVGRVDAVVLSHGHRDHAGGLHLRDQVGMPPVYAPAPVARMLPPALAVRPLAFTGTTEVCGIRITTGRNGHSPGGAWLHLDVPGGLVYMGDYGIESPIYVHDLPPRAATLIVDGSYGNRASSLVDCINELAPVFERNAALLPIPVMGRGPEILFHAARTQRSLPCVGDDLRAAIVRIANDFGDSLCPGIATELVRIARDAPPISGPGGIILTGYADATEGEAARLVGMWENEPDPEIVFTGYIPDGTPAERMVKSGRARHVSWNVHPRMRDNAALVATVRPDTVLPAFCESRYLPDLVAAFAPAHVVMETPITW